MIPLRSPDTVMRLSRLGAAQPTRLSFLRVLLRKMQEQGWRMRRDIWDVDTTGEGHATYQVVGAGQTLTLVAFAHNLPDEARSDRVIAEAWDATFALVQGVPTPQDIEKLSQNVPYQEAGRMADSTLVLSRANRSTRLWTHIVDALAAGRQPDAAQIEAVGYLMRTTAVYGSGKFGMADFAALRGHPLLDGPFRAEMLAVWLIRCFQIDLVEHMAKAKGGARAAQLAPALKRRIGIGNATGLGMAPFLVNHPRLLNAWITARETALSRVRNQLQTTDIIANIFLQTLSRMREQTVIDTSRHPHQLARNARLQNDLTKLTEHCRSIDFTTRAPWDRLWRWGEAHLTEDGQEALLSLLLEPHGELIDDLAETMAADERKPLPINGKMTCVELRALVEQHYAWALEKDYAAPEHCGRFWYVSAAKLEPRLGERFAEDGAALEFPLDIARAVAALASALTEYAGRVADFLRTHPDHRHTIRRVQAAADTPYMELRENLIAADMLPVDMLRAKLAFFGAARFDPRSDRWLRITMYQGVPVPDAPVPADTAA